MPPTPSTSTPTMISSRSTNREAVQRAYNNKSTMEEEQEEEEEEERTTAEKKNKNDNNKSLSSSSPSLSSSNLLLSFMEFIFISIYKCMNIGIHFILFISFLALISIHCLGTFHDEYFLTLLHRARRTDIDLQTEITYYHRQCSLLDVTSNNVDFDPY
jgi:cation transport ATPase